MILKSLYAKSMCQDVNPISCPKKGKDFKIFRFLYYGGEKTAQVFPIHKSLKDTSVFIKYQMQSGPPAETARSLYK